MRVALTLVFAFTCYTSGFSWGLTGHRVVAEIASYYLTPKAKKEIASLLDNQSMAMVANWADFIKSDSSYNYTHDWHFVNLPENLSYAEATAFLTNSSDDNIYSQTLKLQTVLKSPTATKEEKAFALKFIIHLIGDMHQPMHLGRKEDWGGNKIYVKWFGKKSNLHRVWDEDIVDFQQLSYTEMAQAYNVLAKKNLKLWQEDPITLWCYESYEISRILYAQIEQMDDKDPNLKFHYNYINFSILESQLAKGGVRLAAFLNQTF